MADAGIGEQSAIGGYELALGSKPSLHGISFYGLPGSTGGTTFYVNGDGKTYARSGGTLNANSVALTATYGAGFVTLAAASGGYIAGTWVIGTGAAPTETGKTPTVPDGDDDRNIIMAMGDYAYREGAAMVAAGTSALGGTCNVTSINGGTVSFILSIPDEAAADVDDADGIRLSLWAWVKGGI